MKEVTKMREEWIEEKCEEMGTSFCRSDWGDGGWSIHDGEDEDLILLDGTATRVGECWDRPDHDDFAELEEILEKRNANKIH